MNYQKPDVEKVVKIRRYTSLRYLNAILFFICLYWLFSLLLVGRKLSALIPILIMILILVTVKDHYYSFTNKDVDMKRSKIIYTLIVFIYIILAIITAIDYTKFFPYVANNNYAFFLLAVMIFLSILLYIKAIKIYKNKDRVYVKYMNNFNKNNNKRK